MMTENVTPLRQGADSAAPSAMPASNHPTIAPLTNVAATVNALRAATQRSIGLPGLVVLHGPSGWGKSTAAAYAAVQLRGYYVQCQTLWSRTDFILAVAREMGLETKGRMAIVAERISEQLTMSGRPLLIDEAHVLVERATGAGALKDIHDATGGSILLIGEEMLPQRMTRYERLHGRVLEWVSAQPCSLHDTQALARIYAPGLELAPDMAAKLAKSAKGSVRRVAVLQ
jgi:DNA transposition AAA+ family ATPase